MLLLILAMLASVAEILSIGSLLPFLSVLTAPDQVFALPVMQPIILRMGIASPSGMLLPLTIFFAVAALTAGGVRLLLLWASTRFSFAIGADLGIDMYRRTLYQSYATHLSRNSSEIISGISIKANDVIYKVVLPCVQMVSASVMLVFILGFLLVIEPVVTTISFAGFGFIYLSIIKLTRKRLSSDSQCIAYESVRLMKALQEGLGGIRDVLIDGSQEVYCQIYRESDLRLRRAQGNSAFISTSPRYVMEVLGMVLISALAYVLAGSGGGDGGAIPILGALALGAQRLLPVMQQAYWSFTIIQSGQASLNDSLELLDQPFPANVGKPLAQLLPFNREIRLKQLGFRYNPDASFIFNKMDLSIAKGSRVGFIGSTGSGKSTLLDIVMGLLQPTEGAIEVDGCLINDTNSRAWQGHIAHVPQAIFLADTTVEENIAFGTPKELIDHARVRRAAVQAQIADVIESWPEQYETFVGERGVRLSGGQRQRIGIARALYKEADVIVFDEATSALDNDTENSVMEAIENLSGSHTLLIIAHRLTTLKGCTQIVELGNGAILQVGSYDEIIEKINLRAPQ